MPGSRGRSGRLRPFVAGALVALMAGVSLGPLLHSGTGHDTDCGPVIVVHDASQHRFSAPPPAAEALPSGEHCVVCHLFRSHRSSAATEAARTHHLAISLVASISDRSAARDTAVSPLPARAPPALS